MAVNKQVYSAKVPAEIVDRAWDFSERLLPGETIVEAQVAIAVERGTTTGPMTTAADPVHDDTTVTQRVTGGQVATVYRITFTATTSTGQVLVEDGYQPVV